MPPLSALAAHYALAFLVLLSRVSGAVMVMPGLGEQDLPMLVRAGAALSVTLLLLPPLMPILGALPTEQLNAAELAGIVAVELFAGILIGWLARLAAMALTTAGQMIAVFTGLSSVLQTDPDLGAGSTAPARFFNLLAPLLLLMSGAYILPLHAVVGSYTLIHPGMGVITRAPPLFVADSLHAILKTTESTFQLALELSAPFLILSLSWQMMLGIMTRLLPTLQITNTASPLQIFGGVAILALILRAITMLWESRTLTLLHGLPGL